MSEITPITRAEKLWNGEDLEPLTREEMYIKRIFDKTQTIPDKPLTRKEILMEKAGEGGGGDVTIKQLSVTANGTYSEEGTAYSPVNVAVPLPENAYLLKTASGSLVSFDDGADLPMPSFICNIDAVQDLHGQDAPWVGGAGKNKAESVANDWSNKGITATKNDDGSYSITGTATENVTSNFLVNVYPVSAGEEYIVTNKKNQTDTATKYTRCVCSFYNDSTYKSEINISEGQTITVPSGVNRIRLSYVWNNGFVVPAGAIIYPMIRLSTETDPTFAPYSNICPISGHTGVDAVISPTTEASAGTTYSVSWQTEAGEVFGGYVDLVSGVMTVDRAYVEYDGSSDEIWTIAPQDATAKIIGNAPGIVTTYTPVLSNNFTTYEASAWSYDNSIWGRYGQLHVNPDSNIIPSGITQDGVAEWKTWLSTHNLQICYPLATPITYQLTPTQIKSLLGNNNAWCSTGDVDIDYFAKEVTG